MDHSESHIENSYDSAADIVHTSRVPSKVIGNKGDIVYRDRISVRTITRNNNKEILLIFVKNGGYYKLPGGGVESGEDHFTAAERESIEETGCKIKISGNCFATSEEWRMGIHQISYCYCADLVEDTGLLQLTEEEIEDGFQHEWTSLEIAIRKMRECQPTTEFGKFVRERELFFLEIYAKLG